MRRRDYGARPRERALPRDAERPRLLRAEGVRGQTMKTIGGTYAPPSATYPEKAKSAEFEFVRRHIRLRDHTVAALQ